MRTIIAGSRNMNDYELLLEVVAKCPWPITTVISGTAQGADRLGERWAAENRVPLERFPANWEKYGRAAGHIRNGKMAEYGEALIALWDGDSPGTENMIKTAKGRGLRVFVYNDKEGTFLEE